MDEKRGIGKDNKIPWHIKEDLVKLKNLTKDRVVILGRISYDSMLWYYNKSGKPMPGKLYIVVTHGKDYSLSRENAITIGSVQEAVEKASLYCHPEFISGSPSPQPSPSRGEGEERVKEMPNQASPDRHDNGYEVFIIGGGQIFQQALPLADKLYLTIVEGDFNCDTFFPDYSEFRKVISEEEKVGEGHRYKFLELER